MAQSAVPRLPWPLVLASGSPRRRELLARLAPEFEVLVTGEPEEGEWPGPAEAALALARRKAEAGFSARPGCLVLGGDTVVWLPGHGMLGKPEDEEDAVRILLRLQGRAHSVFTGVWLAYPGGAEGFVEETVVEFRPFGEEEARAYVATGEPMDKAGAYGYQAAGRSLVARVQGSESNVVGLPLERLAKALNRLAG